MPRTGLRSKGQKHFKAPLVPFQIYLLSQTPRTAVQSKAFKHYLNPPAIYSPALILKSADRPTIAALPFAYRWLRGARGPVPAAQGIRINAVMTTEAEHRGGARLARRFPHGGSLSPRVPRRCYYSPARWGYGE